MSASYEVPTGPSSEIELEVREGRSAGQRFSLQSLPTVIGRGQDADIRLDDDAASPTLSRRHLKINLEGGRMVVSDLSTNGTWVGARQLNRGEAVVVENDQPIWLGTQTMVVLRRQGAVPPIDPFEAAVARSTSREVVDTCTDAKDVLTVRAFGPFHVAVSGLPIPDENWQARKSIVLLTILADNHPRLVTVERLESLLWPDSEESARSALQKTVSRLRAALRGAQSRSNGNPEAGPRRAAPFNDIVRLDHACYGLSASYQLDYDVSRFETAVKQAAQARATGDVSGEVSWLTEALSLYAGDFLERHEDDWVQSRRSMLSGQRFECAEALARLRLEAGAPLEGLRLYEQVLAENPCREPSQVGAMRALIEAGRRDEAIRAYHGFVRTLKKMLDLPPCPELVTLYESLHR